MNDVKINERTTTGSKNKNENKKNEKENPKIEENYKKQVEHVNTDIEKMMVEKEAFDNNIEPKSTDELCRNETVEQETLVENDETYSGNSYQVGVKEFIGLWRWKKICMKMRLNSKTLKGMKRKTGKRLGTNLSYADMKQLSKGPWIKTLNKKLMRLLILGMHLKMW
jgi:hypothetical protein